MPLRNCSLLFWLLLSGSGNGRVNRFSSGLISDNQAVVAALSLYSRDPPLVHLLRSLFFIKAHFDFEHKVVHIPGEENGIADALSRNDMSSFSSLLPQAALLPSAIPQLLIELLSDQSLLWTSPCWRGLLRSSLLEALQQEQ